VTETRRAAEEQAALRRVATLVAHDTAPDALFAGFPGFRSKLWADDVTTGVYRGIHEWDGAEAARAYATRMVGLLAPFSNADTARFHVVGGLRRDTFLRDPQAAPSDGADGWWRTEQPVETSSQRRFPTWRSSTASRTPATGSTTAAVTKPRSRQPPSPARRPISRACRGASTRSS
jgi:hypothetical protein